MAIEWGMEEIREALALPEPCAIDLLAALSDPEIAERIERRREAARQFAESLRRASQEIYERTIRGKPSEIIMHPRIARFLDEIEEGGEE